MAHTIAEKAIANSRSGNLHGLRSIPSSSVSEASCPVVAASLSLSGSVQAGRRIAAQMLPSRRSELGKVAVAARLCLKDDAPRRGRAWEILCFRRAGLTQSSLARVPEDRGHLSTTPDRSACAARAAAESPGTKPIAIVSYSSVCSGLAGRDRKKMRPSVQNWCRLLRLSGFSRRRGRGGKR